MFNEQYKGVSDTNSIVIAHTMEDALKHKFTGEIFDTFIYPDGTREQIHHGFNLVVNSCSILIASLMKRQAGFSGIGFWAVGSGLAGWSNNTPPSPVAGDTRLVTEIFRKAVGTSDIAYLDVSNNETASPTSRIQIKVTFMENEANGDLREFGLFGGTATATVNSGQMINYKTHGLIFKTSGMKLERILRLTF